MVAQTVLGSIFRDSPRSLQGTPRIIRGHIPNSGNAGVTGTRIVWCTITPNDTTGSVMLFSQTSSPRSLRRCASARGLIKISLGTELVHRFCQKE